MFIKLRGWFLNWLRESDNYTVVKEAEEDEPIKVSRGISAWANAANQIKVRSPSRRIKAGTVMDSPDSDLSSRGIIFKVYPANGGMVIETHNYDEQRECTKNTLHLIPESDDLAEAIAHIITMEAMRG